MTVNLDEVSKPGTVSLGGVVHVVKPMSAKMITVARSAADPIEKLLTVVANRVPTLTEDDIGELTIAQLEKIVDIANAGVAIVEDASPNAVAAEMPPTSPV